MNSQETIAFPEKHKQQKHTLWFTVSSEAFITMHLGPLQMLNVFIARWDSQEEADTHTWRK